MDYTFTGTVKKVGETQRISDRFSKREVVVTSEEERYPQNVAFEFTNDRADLLDGVRESDRVTVHFDISSREWAAPDGSVKYFTSLRAWKLDKPDEAGGKGGAQASRTAENAPAQRFVSSPPPPQAEMPKDAGTAEGNDDLPF